MRDKQFWLMPFRDADGGAGGGGGGDAGAGAPDLVRAAGESAAPDGGGAPAKEGTPPADGAAVYWPEGLPETFAGFKGQNDRETIDKLAGELKGLPRAPEKPDDYKLALPEAFTKRFGDLSKDEVLPIWRQVAHKNGLTEQQFNGAIGELYSELMTKGLIDEPIDVGAELEKLTPKQGDPVSRKAQAAARINGVANTVNGMVTRGVLNRTEGNMVLALAARAEGVVALEKLFKTMSEHGLQGGAGGEGGNQPSELNRAEGNMVLALAARAEGVVALEKLFKAIGEHGLQGGGEGGGNQPSEHERAMRSMFPSMHKA